jgi:hypothetical protein
VSFPPQFLIWLYDWQSRSRIARFAIIPLIVSAPPVVLAVLFHFNTTTVWLKAHWLVALTLGFWPAIIAPGRMLGDRLRLYQKIDREGLVLVVEGMERIVGAKLAKLVDAVKRLEASGTRLDCCEVLKASNPERQMKKIAEQVWVFLSQYRVNRKEDVDLRVVLAAMGNTKVERFVCALPEDRQVRSKIDDFGEMCCFCIAKRERKIQIIEDIKTDTRFQKTRQEYSNEDGSCICYPIIDTVNNAVPYVLSIKASKKGYFEQVQSELYDWVLSRFGVRLLFEYNSKRLEELIYAATGQK